MRGRLRGLTCFVLNQTEYGMSIEGKTAIITGASSGIGAAAAKLFAKHGAHVVLGARRADLLEQVTETIQTTGGVATYVAGDVREESFAGELVEEALSKFGRLDIALNNAGILGETGDICAMTAQSWQTVLDTNLTSGFYAAKHQLPPMRRNGKGSIIFVSSFVGHTVGLPGMSAYAASKAGLIGLTQCLAAEYGAQGIRVNALLPGGTKTNMAGDFSDAPEASDAIASMHALKRMADPEEIAEAALFLATDAASFVTGSAMLVDGGNSITKI